MNILFSNIFFCIYKQFLDYTSIYRTYFILVNDEWRKKYCKLSWNPSVFNQCYSSMLFFRLCNAPCASIQSFILFYCYYSAILPRVELLNALIISFGILEQTGTKSQHNIPFYRKKLTNRPFNLDFPFFFFFDQTN